MVAVDTCEVGFVVVLEGVVVGVAVGEEVLGGCDIGSPAKLGGIPPLVLGCPPPVSPPGVTEVLANESTPSLISATTPP